MSSLYPVMMQLVDRLVVIVGSGERAAERAEDLLGYGARVRVVAPEPCGRLKALDGVELRERPFHAGDLEEAALAFVATNDHALAERVSHLASRGGIAVNVHDEPELSDFQMPAHFRRGQLTLAVSTGGTSPALARVLKVELSDAIGPEYERLTALLGVLRAAVREKVADPGRRREILLELGSAGTRDLFLTGGAEAVERLCRGLIAEATGTRP